MIKMLLVLTSLSLLLFANNDKKITLQLNWLNQFQFAGYYIAKEKGFYKDVGLDVEIKEFESNTNLLKDIETNKADFAIGRSSLLLEKANGEDVIALGAIFQESPLMLLVRKDSNINKVQDLKDKKIMITPDAAFSASLLAMLSANNLKKNDYIIQKHSFDINDLIVGNTDAMASYLSNEPIRLKDRDIAYKIFHPRDYGFHFYSDILFTSSKFIKNYPSVTKDFYEASIKGWKYAFKNKAETAELIYIKYNTQNKSYIHLIKEGETLEKLAYANNKDIGDLDNNKLENIFNVFKLFGLVKKDIDIESFIYDENPHKTMRLEITNTNQKIIIFTLLFTIFIILIIIYYLNKNRQINNLLHTLINSTNDIITYKDCNLRYIGCNKSFEDFIGKKESEIIGKTDFEIYNSDDAKLYNQKDIDVLSKNEISTSNEWLVFGNEKKLYQNKKMPFRYKKNGKYGIVSISRDITELNEVWKKLKNEAYYDELTTIFNRKAFNERIEEKFDLYRRYGSDFCIAMYDIDDFKNINDTYGHDIGDKVLIEMTKAIKQNIRKTDLIFRVGGEEFIVIFPKTSIKEAISVMEKIRDVVSKMNIIENKKITISIGITQVKKEDTPSTIYERIDKLMYVSKHEGKNRTSQD